MRRAREKTFHFFSLAFAVVVVLAGPSRVEAQEWRTGWPRRAWVSDEGGRLDASLRSRLARDLVRFEKETGIQIAVAIVTDTRGLTLPKYALGLVERWREERRDMDNAVILLIRLKKPRAWIQIGSAASSALYMDFALRILRERTGPRLKANELDRAVDESVRAIMAGIRGESMPPAGPEGILFVRAMAWLIGFALCGLGVLLQFRGQPIRGALVPVSGLAILLVTLGFWYDPDFLEAWYTIGLYLVFYFMLYFYAKVITAAPSSSSARKP